MKNKNAERIWKNTKSTIDSVQSFMKLMKLKATSDEEWARLSNLELQFLRGILYSESEKYVNEKKPLITKEGSYFAIDGYAIEECIRKILINNYKKAKKINPDIQTPLEHDINEEVKTWTSLGKHPQIYDAALKSYKKGMLACMDALAKLCNDKTLEFGRPITKAIKNFFKGMF